MHPAVVAVSLGVVSAALAVLLYGLLTIILAIALDTASRRRETARLQILGLSNRADHHPGDGRVRAGGRDRGPRRPRRWASA